MKRKVFYKVLKLAKRQYMYLSVVSSGYLKASIIQLMTTAFKGLCAAAELDHGSKAKSLNKLLTIVIALLQAKLDCLRFVLSRDFVHEVA